MIKENVQHEYQKCDNPSCGYAPAFDKAEDRNASDWANELLGEHNRLLVEGINLEADTKTRPTLLAGLRNKNKRLLEEVELKMRIAEAISDVVDATTQGQITLHAPELGLLVQFTWGGFQLFKSLGEVK